MKKLFGPTVFIKFNYQSYRTFGEQIADHLGISDYRQITTELLTSVCQARIAELDNTPYTRLLQFTLEFVEESYEPGFTEIDLSYYPISVKQFSRLGIEPCSITTPDEWFNLIGTHELWKHDGKHGDVIYAHPDTETETIEKPLIEIIRDGNVVEVDVYQH